MVRILVRWKGFRNSLEILCHPICNRLYFIFWDVALFHFVSSIHGTQDLKRIKKQKMKDIIKAMEAFNDNLVGGKRLVKVRHTHTRTHTHMTCSSVTRLIRTCAVTHSYVTRLIGTCDVMHAYVTWLICVCYASIVYDMTHAYVTWRIDVWHDSVMCDITHPHIISPIHSFICLQQQSLWLQTL